MIDLKNWGIMRIVRLVAGSLILWNALADHQPVLGVLGGFLILQAVFNTGCRPNGCGIPSPRKTPNTSVKEIDYEEVQ